MEPPSELQASSQHQSPGAASPGPPASDVTQKDPPQPGKAKTAKEDSGFDKPEPGVVDKKKGKKKKLREHPKNPQYDTLRNVADDVLGEPEDGPDIDQELAKGKKDAANKAPETKKPKADSPGAQKSEEPKKSKEASKTKPEASKPDKAVELEVKAGSPVTMSSPSGAADRTSQDYSGSSGGGDKSTPASAGPGASARLNASPGAT